MKYPQILREQINQDYWKKFEMIKLKSPPETTNYEIYQQLEEDMPYYNSYGSFRNGLLKYRKYLKKQRNEKN